LSYAIFQERTWLHAFLSLGAVVWLAPSLAFGEPAGHSLNVVEFGAKMDGTTDDTEAFQKALDAAPNFSALHIPAGTAVLSGPLTVEGKTLSIQGEGMFVTRLVWRKPGGLRLTESKASPIEERATFQISNLSFLADGADLGTALSASFDDTTFTPSIIIEDCQFMPTSKTPRGAKFWTQCVDILNMRLSRISGCRFTGCNGEDMTKTTHLIHLRGNCTSFVIDSCHGSNSQYGVEVEGETEGVLIDKSFFVHNECGYVFNVRGEPMFDLNQSHAASSRYGIQIINGRNCSIVGCFIALRGDVAVDGPSAGIRLEGPLTRQIAIAATTMHYNSKMGRLKGPITGIDVAEGKCVTVTGCIVRGMDYGIAVGEGASEATLSANRSFEITKKDLEINPKAKDVFVDKSE